MTDSTRGSPLPTTSARSSCSGCSFRWCFGEWCASGTSVSPVSLGAHSGGRGRVRSKYRPFGFAPSEPFTAQLNLIAIRVAFWMWLAHFNGQ